MKLALLLTLTACDSADSARDTAAAVQDSDSGGNPDTGDTGLDSWCADLVNPWPLSTAEDVAPALYAATPNVVLLTSLIDSVMSAAASEPDCATIVVDEATNSITISGDCSGVLGTFVGTATLQQAPGSVVASFDRFSFLSLETGEAFEADGELDMVGDVASVDLWYHATVDGDEVGPRMDTFELTMGESAQSYIGRFEIEASDAGAGDLCIDWQSEPAQDGCVDERPGVLKLHGSGEAVVSFEGTPGAACDGCGSLTLDGGEAGTSCP